MSWKEYLKPSRSKVLWFIFLWVIAIIPSPICWPDGPCYILASFFYCLFIPPGLVLEVLWRIYHLTDPMAICHPTLVNCSRIGDIAVLSIWSLQWFSLITNYLLACYLTRFSLKRRVGLIIVVGGIEFLLLIKFGELGYMQ